MKLTSRRRRDRSAEPRRGVFRGLPDNFCSSYGMPDNYFYVFYDIYYYLIRNLTGMKWRKVMWFFDMFNPLPDNLCSAYGLPDNVFMFLYYNHYYHKTEHTVWNDVTGLSFLTTLTECRSKSPPIQAARLTFCYFALPTQTPQEVSTGMKWRKENLHWLPD